MRWLVCPCSTQGLLVRLWLVVWERWCWLGLGLLLRQGAVLLSLLGLHLRPKRLLSVGCELEWRLGWEPGVDQGELGFWLGYTLAQAAGQG